MRHVFSDNARSLAVTVLPEKLRKKKLTLSVDLTYSDNQSDQKIHKIRPRGVFADKTCSTRCLKLASASVKVH